MKKKLLLIYSMLSFVLISNITMAQWTKTILPDPPGGHGALPGRVTSLVSSGANLYAGTLGGNLYYSEDNGSNWAYIDSGLTTSDINVLMFYNNSLYVGTYGSGIFITSDNGKSWKGSGQTLTNPYIYSLVAKDSALYAATWGNGVFVSSDYGNSWSQCNDDGLTNLYVRTLCIKDNRLYAGTWGDGIFLSDDYGSSWTKSNSGVNKLYIYTITKNNSMVYFGNDDGVYSSANDGFTWNLLDSGLTTTYIRALVVIDPNLLVGTSGQGVFVSINGGALWTAVDTGLTDGFIYCFAVSGSKLFAGSLNGEIWSRSLDEIVTGIKEKFRSVIADNFMLYQNYPNPFNPTTTIGYSLQVNSFVTLKVYDAIGREVETLVNKNQNAGNYSVSFSGTNLTSGIYFYRLKTGSYSSVKKMILIK